MNKSIYAAILIIIALPGCKSNDVGHLKDVTQNEVYQEYTVSYDEERGTTEISATLRFAGSTGTTLIADAPAFVHFNNKNLDLNQNDYSGAYYSASFTGPLTDGLYPFVFKDLKGKVYTNTLDFKNMDIEELPKEITSAEDLKILFIDDPEGRNETIIVNISDTAHSISESFTRVRRDRVIIPKEKLQILHGEVVVDITRNGNFALKQATHIGGDMRVEYHLKPRKCVIK